MSELVDILKNKVVHGELYREIACGRVQCFACAHTCAIADGEAGICRMRFNRGGALYVPCGYVSGMQCDPIEKKPFFHFLPGAGAFSYGMLGCNFKCDYCQNWVTSQTLRDPESLAFPMATSPTGMVAIAHAQGADVIVSTYNEPLITTEWNVSVFKTAKAAGLMTAYVSNGYGTPESLQYLHPWIDAYKVDLKSFNDDNYRALGGRLSPVLETIRGLRDMKVWVEIVTLLVPGFNDSPKELSELTAFIAGISTDIPWHVTAFHGNYKRTGSVNTAAGDLLRAVEIGKRNGLRFVYAGNLAGRLQNLENTYCPGCGRLLVERYGFAILRNNLSETSRCPSCKRDIPGIWSRNMNQG
ncbi:MAG TPA: AmmeMemoRadiSam system radical SAM enzyme [Acidobacteriota bacterium]|nr:AmmeMemoRadiSam system radical SAM enzyme [Acidobacteriota bacterium]